MDTESHITIYETLGPNPANNKKNIFIYNVSNSSIHYDVNEIESLKGNYKNDYVNCNTENPLELQEDMT